VRWKTIETAFSPQAVSDTAAAQASVEARRMKGASTSGRLPVESVPADPRTGSTTGKREV